MDSADVRFYRPISNLSVLSKFLERLVHRQMLDYLNRHRLLPRLQSVSRLYHSTETVVLRVLADILHAVDTGDLSILALLNAAARLIYRRRRFDHVTPLLRDFHWLKVPESRVAYKLAVTVYRCLHGMPPPYLCDGLQRVAELNRSPLRSSMSNALVVPSTRLKSKAKAKS